MAKNNYGQKQSSQDLHLPKISTIFKSNWISEGADSGMIKFAEEAGRALADYDYVASNPQNKARDKYKLTTSQIRNVYSEIKRIQSRSYDNEVNRFYLLKPKVAYATARATSSKEYGMGMFKEQIFDEAFQYVKDAKTYENFCNLMEAVLAYHRYYGGK